MNQWAKVLSMLNYGPATSAELADSIMVPHAKMHRWLWTLKFRGFIRETGITLNMNRSARERLKLYTLTPRGRGQASKESHMSSDTTPFL